MTTVTVTFPEDYVYYGQDNVDYTASVHGWGGQEGNVFIPHTNWMLPDLTTGTPSSAETVKTAIDALGIEGVTTTIE